MARQTEHRLPVEGPSSRDPKPYKVDQLADRCFVRVAEYATEDEAMALIRRGLDWRCRLRFGGKILWPASS
jgi:hypothetical protein